jgi:hypothetical protein
MCTHIGRLDDAREIAKRLRAITHAVMEPGTGYRNPELRELSYRACGWQPVRRVDTHPPSSPSCALSYFPAESS